MQKYRLSAFKNIDTKTLVGRALEIRRSSRFMVTRLFKGASVTQKQVLFTDAHLAVSDTGNHRVLLCTTDGQVDDVVGSGVPGLKDGDFATAQFNSPQGVAWSSTNSLYVADCENHCIRKVCLLLCQLT